VLQPDRRSAEGQANEGEPAYSESC
jgi:hypothetical protein